MKILVFALMFVLVFSIPQTIMAAAGKAIGEIELGHDKGNGSELGSERIGSVSWFSGTRTVLYCLDIAKGFPVDRATLEKKINVVIEQWVELIRTSDRYYFKAILKDLALDYQLIPSCGFGEDIKFYFGSSSAEVETARKGYRNPVAVAQQTELDKGTARSKGFIWLAPHGSLTKAGRETNPTSTDVFPNWQKDHQLHAILLHEIGHVFGADHIAGTIMSKWISFLIREESIQAKSHQLGTDYLYHINQQRMVLHPVTNSYEFTGRLGNYLFPAEVRPKDSGDTREEEVFEKLLGRKHKGPIKAKAFFKSDYDGPSEIKLTVADDLSAKDFSFNMDNNRSEFWILDSMGSGVTVGRISKYTGYVESQTGSDTGRTYTGSVKTANGKSLRILAQMNMMNPNYLFTNNGPLLIGFLDKDKKWKFLFEAGLIYQKF
jgi:hypothetical protein